MASRNLSYTLKALVSDGRITSQDAQHYQKEANIIARQNSFSIATEVILGKENKIIDYTRYGYRKYTTGEYVPAKYRNNFGWKNTYYQPALVSVEIKVKLNY